MGRYLANGGTFRYSEDEERLAASTSDFAPWAQRAGPPAAADGASPFHFVCECFFMTAATLHVGAGQLIESMQTSQREYEHLLQQGPLARQDIVRFFFSNMFYNRFWCNTQLPNPACCSIQKSGLTTKKRVCTRSEDVALQPFSTISTVCVPAAFVSVLSHLRCFGCNSLQHKSKTCVLCR